MKRIVDFIRESYIEFRKVHWPSRSEVYQQFFIVIGIVLFFALILGLFDNLLTLAVIELFS